MKFTATFIFATLSALVFGTLAQAFSNDYSHLSARAELDALMYERSAPIEVPFQHSLRSFLEEAVTAHQRALSADEDVSLQTRWVTAMRITFTHKVGGAKAKSQTVVCSAEETLEVARAKLSGIGISAVGLTRAHFMSAGRNLDLHKSAHANNLADGSIVNVYVG
ncbi:hypothetical protein DFP72DRAFT_1114634 [Ephemerocybe angulata]|uniref:Uncharacterized protein n=1 Tax=Ephemerocybe angulata TaxID=980116 RepID=A0A8H6I2Y8_9AGAR|nr:hypothetical protein DFP72DRAFT_1114634 [Tulosesus angulatus]